MSTRFWGKYRGAVVDDQDPDTLGRLKVKVPALGDVAVWALPCTPYAGKGVGWFVLPPVGAKVWVEFEGGEPDFPIWTGCFWDDPADLPAVRPAERGNPAAKVLALPGVALQFGGQTCELRVGAPISDTPLRLTLANGKITLSSAYARVELTEKAVTTRVGASKATVGETDIALATGVAKIELTSGGIESTAGSTRIGQDVANLRLQNGAAEVALSPASVNINDGALEVI